MLFGLQNALATFICLMNRVVIKLEGCTVYLDDMVAFSDSLSEHLKLIKSLFDCLFDAHLS